MSEERLSDRLSLNRNFTNSKYSARNREIPRLPGLRSCPCNLVNETVMWALRKYPNWLVFL